MDKNILTNSLNVADFFCSKTYFIDFYQREYVWIQDTVLKLLDDIYSKFLECYTSHKGQTQDVDFIEKEYDWYYLNTVILNEDKDTNKKYIVDGQQRSTTLTLICLALLSIVKKEEFSAVLDNEERDSTIELLRNCIYGRGSGSFAFSKQFVLDHEKRNEIMSSLLKDEIPDDNFKFKNKTEKNLVDRYKDVLEYLQEKFRPYLEKENLNKIKAFITFFLLKVKIVQIVIPENKDTPMVFEVINDRGEHLKPFQILKGKLIGSIPKIEVDDYSEKWDEYLNRIDGNEDSFFLTYFRSKYLNNELKELNELYYHRYIYLDNPVSNTLGFKKTDPNNVHNIKEFINIPLNYYTDLYQKLLQSDNEFISYERDIFDLAGQYQIIMAACENNDKEETRKIESLAKEYDRLYMILRLNNLYDSNDLQDITFKICSQLRGAQTDSYRNIFDNCLKEVISKKLNSMDVNNILDYSRFQGLQYSTSTYFYYIFARVEKFLCEKLNKGVKVDVKQMSTKHGAKTGFQIEHIFSRNDENVGYFKDPNDFENRRNNIGALLVLKGNENISSGNEQYSDKLKTYIKGPIWAQTLCKDFYHANPAINTLNEEIKKKSQVSFEFIETFDTECMEKRSLLLYELVKMIWEID